MLPRIPHIDERVVLGVRRFVSAFVVIAIIVLFINLVLDNPYTHHIARMAINEKINEHTNLRLDFKAVKVNALPPTLDLYGIALYHSSAPTRPLIQASHIRTRLSLLSVVFGEPALSVLAATDLDAEWPLPIPPEKWMKESEDSKSESDVDESEPLKWPPGRIPVESIVLANSRFSISVLDEDEFGHVGPPINLVDARFAGIDLEVNIGSWEDMTAEIDVSSVDFRFEHKPVISGMRVLTSIDVIDNRVRSSEFIVDSEHLDFSGHLTASILSNAKSKVLERVNYGLEGAVNGDIVILGKILDIEDTGGPVRGDLQIKGNYSPSESEQPFPVITAQAQSDGALINEFKIHDSKVDLVIDDKKVTFADVELLIDQKNVGKGKGYIGFERPINFAFDVQPNGITLVQLLDVFDVDFDVIDFGIYSKDLSLRGIGKPFQLNVEATGDLGDLHFPSLGIDSKNFAFGPICRMNVELFATEAGIQFDGSRGRCFDRGHDRKEWESVVPRSLVLPEGSRFASDIVLNGYASFEDDGKIDMSVASPQFDLALTQFFSQQSSQGNGSFLVAVTGDYDDTKVNISAKGNEAHFAEIPLGNFGVDVEILDGAIAWKELEVSYPSGGAIKSTRGSITYSEPFVIDTDIDAHQVDRQFLKAAASLIIPEEKFYAGIGVLKGRVKGPVESPFGLELDLTARLLQANLRGIQLFDELSGNVIATKQGWKMNQAEIKMGSLDSVLNVEHTRTKPFSYKYASSRTDVWERIGFRWSDKVKFDWVAKPKSPELVSANLRKVPLAGDFAASVGLDGSVSGRASFEGTLKQLDGDFDFEIAPLTLLNSELAPLRLKGVSQGSAIDTIIEHSGDALEGRMSFDFLADNVPYDLYVHTERFDLRALGSSLFHQDPRNYFYLSSDLKMKGSLTDWWRSHGELRINAIEGRFVRDRAEETKSVDVSYVEPITLQMNEEGWNFENGKTLAISSEVINLEVKTNKNQPPTNLGLYIDGKIDLGLANQLFTEVETAAGWIGVKASLEGPVDDPNFDLELRNLKSPGTGKPDIPLSFGLADARPPFQNIEFLFEYHDGDIVVKHLRAAKGNGTVSAQGLYHVFPKAGEESRIEVILDEASLIYPVAVFKSFETSLKGSLSVSGTGLPMRLGGDLQIVRARSTGDFDIRKEIVDTLRRRSFQSQSRKTRSFVELDLNLIADQSILISNRNIQATLSSNLRISGTDAQPVMSGQIEIDRGKLIYKRDFNVTQGVIVFDDPLRIDPKLDIYAVSEVSNYRVYVNVTGKASDPKIELSIDPATRDGGAQISKLEILTLLSTGQMPPANAQASETSSVAQSEVLNVLVGQFEQPIEKLFDMSGQTVVRQVYIDTYSSDEGQVIPRFNMPVNLGTNWDAIFQFSDNRVKVATEYDLHQNISVLGSFDGQEASNSTSATGRENVSQDTAIDLKFRFSFP